MKTSRHSEFLTVLVALLMAGCLLGFFRTRVEAQQKKSNGEALSSEAPMVNGRITVGANVHVSRAFADRPHYEVYLATNPRDPNNLLGCAIIDGDMPGERNRDVAYTSSDAGRTWRPTLIEKRALFSSDPVCGFGPDGTAYFSGIMRGVLGGYDGFNKYPDDHTFVYRSKDGGNTWAGPTDLPLTDRPFLGVDTSGGKYHGRVYLAGSLFIHSSQDAKFVRSLMVSHSADGGATFSGPTLIASVEPRGIDAATNGVVLSDGTYIVVYKELKDVNQSDHQGDSLRPPTRPTGELIVVASSDGGRTLQKVSVAGQVIGGGGRAFLGVGMASLAVDSSKGPFQDRLYLIWPDFRSGRCEVLLSYSDDKGKTWSQATVVDDYRPGFGVGVGSDTFLPTVAVNEAGMVGVAWYDRRDQKDNLSYSLRFAASVDGGETFLPSVEVSPVASYQNDQLRLRANTRGGGNREKVLSGGPLVATISFNSWVGDTSGLAASPDGTFHIFWIDHRTGIPQIWTAPVTVAGRAARNGSDALSALSDISSKVTLDLTNAVFDRAGQIITIHAVLVNTSKDVLSGPIKIRARALQSEIGIVTAANADNQQTGRGAIWDFTDTLNKGLLKPGERSEAKRLSFRLVGAEGLEAGMLARGQGVLRFVQLELKALGRAGS